MGDLAVASCPGAGAYGEEQQGQKLGAQGQPQDMPPKPTYPPQDPDKPPYPHDKPIQNAPDASPPPARSVPGTLTVPAGTILLIRINEYLSSDHNQIGDHFTAVLENPLVVNGWVVARRAQVLDGPLTAARKAVL